MRRAHGNVLIGALSSSYSVAVFSSLAGDREKPALINIWRDPICVRILV